MARGRVAAAHFCYHLCNIPFGSYGDNETCKYSLLGIDHTRYMYIYIYLSILYTLSLSISMTTGFYPTPEHLVRTEVLEYALGLSKAEFLLPNFQTFKLIHVFKLIEAGLTKKV